ncbi:MAG: nitrite/sulfite reductase, partial [Sphingomonadales bacterium]|nr:nitrite/sulfite reductase [Sphingomonadales bacterium]
DIGILGLERAGTENYQITLGGDPGNAAAIGERLGPGIGGDAVPAAIEAIVETYLALRRDADESFGAVLRRVGQDPFKPALQQKEPARAAA